MKYVLGYDPEMLLRDHVKIVDFLHPADQQWLFSKRDQSKRFEYSMKILTLIREIALFSEVLSGLIETTIAYGRHLN